MADTESKGFEPTDEDFESWSDERESESVREAAGMFKTKYVVGGGTFFAKAPSGSVYRLPLGISIDQFEALSSEDDVESVSALKAIVETFAPDDAEKLAGEPILVLGDMLSKYGSVVAKVQGASLGE